MLDDEVARRLRAAESQIVPAGSPITLVSLATKEAIHSAVDRALARIEAVKRITMAVLSATNRHDWVRHGEDSDQDDSPYLQTSGCEKIMKQFEIEFDLQPCVTVGHPEDNTYEFVFQGRVRAHFFSDIWYPVVGSRWSGDGFFTKGGKVRPDPGDVRKAALTNAYNRGIQTALGLRNLSWEDLERYAGIKKAEVAKVSYEGGKHKGAERTQAGTSAALGEGPRILVNLDYQDKTSQGIVKGLAQDERLWDGNAKVWVVKATKHNYGVVMDLVATGRGVKYKLEGTTDEEMQKA